MSQSDAVEVCVVLEPLEMMFHSPPKFYSSASPNSTPTPNPHSDPQQGASVPGVRGLSYISSGLGDIQGSPKRKGAQRISPLVCCDLILDLQTHEDGVT